MNPPYRIDAEAIAGRLNPSARRSPTGWWPLPGICHDRRDRPRSAIRSLPAQQLAAWSVVCVETSNSAVDVAGRVALAPLAQRILASGIVVVSHFVLLLRLGLPYHWRWPRLASSDSGLPSSELTPVSISS